MADWQQAFYYTMRFEDSGLTGVISYDSGGTTRFGVSQKAHPEVYPEMENCDVPEALQIAKNVYRQSYWCGDKLTSQDVANKIADLRFNMGAGMGVKLAQRAVGVEDDGIWGPKTEAAVNAMAEQECLNSLRTAAVAYYQDVVKKHPEDAKYLRGWTARAIA